MEKIAAFLFAAAASAVIAADIPFWGEDNGEATNVVVSASAVSASAASVAVRTTCEDEADPIPFSSYRRGLVISFR